MPSAKQGTYLQSSRRTIASHARRTKEQARRSGQTGDEIENDLETLRQSTDSALRAIGS
jgi:hypothetical protein